MKVASTKERRGKVTMAAAAVMWLGLALPALAQTVTRGPYLQTGTPQSIIVRWRTDAATDSRVRYGTEPGSLSSFADDPETTTEHVVTVSGLSANTTYYYSVGTTTVTLAGDDADHFFLTSPAQGTPKATRIWILGDSGTANANAEAVRDAYLNFAGTSHTDLWLMLGDNAYEDGTDDEYQDAVFDMYPSMLKKSVLWPTLGNHDGHTADSETQTGPYYDIFSLPKNGEAGGLASGTEAYYSFDYGNVHFICLESYETSRSPSDAMMTWLANDVNSTTRDWVIAFWHHPPYSKGSHNSDTEIPLVEMRQNALPILETAGVDLVLAGHSHSYERSFLLDGHYGTSDTLESHMKKDAGSGREDDTGTYTKPVGTPNEGAVYVVAGSSGSTGGGALNHPAMYISLNSLGSLVLDIDGNRLDAKFLRSTGEIGDYFTVIKAPPPPPTVEVAGIVPNSGSSAGGTVVTITGTNFQPGATVTIGGVPATSVSVLASTEIEATTPPLSPGTLNDVVVANPDSSSGTLANGWFSDFQDVPELHAFHNFVESLFRNNLTIGCGGGNYCPADSVTRDQMAVFLLKGKHGVSFVPPPATGTVFEDVPAFAFAADWIEQFSVEGITSGCSTTPPLYCPGSPTTRSSMAVFLLKAKYGGGYVPSPATGIFADVPPSDPLAPWIERLFAEGITGGCSASPLLYCPDDPNTRGEMSVFLARTFNLP